MPPLMGFSALLVGKDFLTRHRVPQVKEEMAKFYYINIKYINTLKKKKAIKVKDDMNREMLQCKS